MTFVTALGGKQLARGWLSSDPFNPSEHGSVNGLSRGMLD